MTKVVESPAPQAEHTAPLTAPTGLDHVNLHVRDADAALRFYTEVLGLTIDWVDRDAADRATFVVLDAGPHNVFLMRTPDYSPPAQRRSRGLNHVCIMIRPSEPAALLDALRARGVALRSELVWRGSAARRTCSIYIEDLDGHGIELKQALSPDQAAAWGAPSAA